MRKPFQVRSRVPFDRTLERVATQTEDGEVIGVEYVRLAGTKDVVGTGRRRDKTVEFVRPSLVIGLVLSVYGMLMFQ